MPNINGLPSGDNKCIGSYSNETTGKLYSFIWNSNGDHIINEYDNLTNKITIILKGSFLGFEENYYINGCSMIGNNLLYWTDGFNPPRGIDVYKAIEGDYYIDSDSISLIKKAPQSLITAYYSDDDSSNTSSNKLKGQLFQFRYLYVYDDGSRSAWSSCSEVPTPGLESISNSDPYKNNNIVLTFNAGDKYVKTVEIACQVKGVSTTVNTTDWFSILSVDRDVILNSTNETYYYNPLNNSATYRFFNDGLYQSIDVLETDLSYDFVPLTSKTLDIINGNVLVLGNNLEGYDNINIDTSVYVDYIDPDLNTTQPGVNEKITYFLNGNVVQMMAGSVPVYQLTKDSTVFPSANITVDYTDVAFYFMTDINSPSENVIPGGIWNFDLYLSLNNLNPYGNTTFKLNVFKYSGSGPYTLIKESAPQTISTTSINLYNIEIDVPETQLEVSDRIVISIQTFPLEYYQVVTLYTEGSYQSKIQTSFPIQDYSTVSKQSYKTNSKYQFGLVYYDQFNRSSYVQTNNTMIISTDSWGDSEGKVPKIGWSINHDAPLWATKYQWVRTEQLTHKNFLYWIATDFNAPAGKDYYELTITTLNAYNTTNPSSILNYSFTKGDRCTVHKANGVWITGYDVDVVGLEQESETDPLILKIGKKTTLTPGSEGILIEIYTPKTRSNSATEQFFYEFGVQYGCSNGEHSITEASFTAGDVYVKLRDIPASPNTILEDPNFSDFYVSNYSSNGRTNIFAPQAKQLQLPTDIRYSDVYVPNTNINGLSRFYGDAYETYDRVNGSIQKISTRDNYLITFQEYKTGYIPVLQSVIEDQGSGNSANVAISNKLLNKIRYFAGDYGIGLHPESFARFAGTIYFADPNRSIVLKLTNSLQDISSVGMNGYFTKNLSEINNVENSKIIGGYDPRNDEYIITLKYDLDEQSSTIAYSELINRWTTFYSFIPENSSYIYNKYFTFKNGKMYVHNSNDLYNTFYGTKYDSVVSLTYNQSPLSIKSFIGIMEQSSSVWIPKSTAIASQPSETILVSSEETAIQTSLNQVSNLDNQDFSLKEGVYFASLLRDVNSPGGLFEGDDLKGNWIKLRLVNESDKKERLLSVDVRNIPSYQGIKIDSYF